MKLYKTKNGITTWTSDYIIASPPPTQENITQIIAHNSTGIRNHDSEVRTVQERKSQWTSCLMHRYQPAVCMEFDLACLSMRVDVVHADNKQLKAHMTEIMAFTNAQRIFALSPRSNWLCSLSSSHWRVHSPVLKRPEREHNHLSTAAVRKAWSYDSTPPYVFTSWCLSKHKNK
jgi:hypothetical protein